jgi:hypothetical protein
MSILALSVILGLSCFAIKAEQTKALFALAVSTSLNEYSRLSSLFLRAGK